MTTEQIKQGFQKQLADAVRCYQIDFGNHLRCKIKVTDKGIEVEGAMNGWGDGIPLDEVIVVEVQ